MIYFVLFENYHDILAMSPLTRYTLLQIPGWLFLACLLWWFVDRGWLSFLTASLIMAAWLVKDALLYPLCKPAFEEGCPTGAEALIGREARSVVPLAPTGLVRLDGEYWSARLRGSGYVDAGRRIRVIAVDGLVLITEPAEP